MTDQEREVVDRYLTMLIRKSKKCKKCQLRHGEALCFFAYECFPNYSWFTEKKESAKDD